MDESLKQLLTLGRGYFEKRQYGQAEKYLSQVVERHQSFADVYNMLGVIYHDQGQFAGAARDLGDLDTAIREYEEIIRQNPGFIAARVNYGIALHTAGRSADAVK